MKILLFLALIGIVAFIIMAVKGYADKEKYEEPEEPVNPPRQLSDAEREAIRQAEDVFDFETRIAIVNGTFEGKLPEYDGYHWTNIYPNIYHTKIAGINYRHGLHDLVGLFFDALIIPEPKNKFDKNAIKIVKADDGRHLGYIPADETDEVRRFINNDFTCHCRAFIEEGEDWDYDLDREKRFLYGYVNIYNNKQNVSPT